MKSDPKKKKEPKGKHNPEKYIEIHPSDTEDSIIESKNIPAVITFGRFNPPTLGHEKLVNKVVSTAKSLRAIPYIYASHTQDKKKNPIGYNDKIDIMQDAFGRFVKKSSSKSIIQVAKELQIKHNELILVVGQDRVDEFTILLNKYNGSEYKFDNIKVISAGDRDPDSDNVAGISASKMRSFAMVGNFDKFREGLPKTIQSEAQNIYDIVREGMGIMEDYNVEELEEARKALSIAQRRKRGITMRRFRNKIKIAREKAKRRMATPEKLKLRAQRKARGIIRDRLMKSKKYGEMSPAEKMQLDTRLLKMPKSMIDKIARRQLPIVRKAEMQRLADRRKPKTEDLNQLFNEHFSTDLNELFSEQFTNEPETPRKKNFRYLFTRNGKVNCDKRLRIFKTPAVAEVFDLMNATETLFEGKSTSKARNAIEREKQADKIKHDRMLDAAKANDKRIRSEEIDKTDPKNREYGTDSLLKILKKDTPGEAGVEDKGKK